MKNEQPETAELWPNPFMILPSIILRLLGVLCVLLRLAMRHYKFRISNFEFVSNFEFRHSDFLLVVRPA
jgi:hypothetical protein